MGKENLKGQEMMDQKMPWRLMDRFSLVCQSDSESTLKQQLKCLPFILRGYTQGIQTCQS